MGQEASCQHLPQGCREGSLQKPGAPPSVLRSSDPFCLTGRPFSGSEAGSGHPSPRDAQECPAASAVTHQPGMWLPGLVPVHRLWIKAQLPFLSVFLYKLQSRHIFYLVHLLLDWLARDAMETLLSPVSLSHSRPFVCFCLLFMFSVQLFKQPQMQAMPQCSLGPQVPQLLSTASVYLCHSRDFLHVKILLS